MDNQNKNNHAPVWAYEKVEIKSHNSNWKTKGAQYKCDLLDLLSAYGVRTIEHVGSTSIPEMPAKPIIDLIALAPSFENLDDIVTLLLQHDWNYIPPELDSQPWRRFFVHVKDDKRMAHLQLILKADSRWKEQVDFRNLLIAEPDLAKQYAALKNRLATLYSNDRESYTRHKSKFVQTVLNSEKDSPSIS
ncbi:hypothetical protein CQS04_05105 [Chryseomicrobium excrementi]|uniref:GrpB family protein n=1 Tax=Chryseomicrobium excrementi TaxID=2041346 RepID=A0A2M9EZB3_9BACL|nr:GrpB family protein [Chryseomicrobium excrementi]PJK16539.1 hypothetical protein CQS04_05105 [Chryseomicrobium excrementi]